MGLCLLVGAHLRGAEGGNPSLRDSNEFGTVKEIVEGYLEFREKVWILNPPLDTRGVDDRSPKEGWSRGREGAWDRLAERPDWFMTHRGKASLLSVRLRERLWSRGDTGDLMVWEEPGSGWIRVGKEDGATGEIRLVWRRRAPEWVWREGETPAETYARELATRRVVWSFRSPHAMEEPEPSFPGMRLLAIPSPEFTVRLEVDASGAPWGTVAFGSETAPGPFALWRNTEGITTGWEDLPGNWMPVFWSKSREGMDAASFDLGETAPDPTIFFRATLGVVDTDGTGGDGLDDGFELWFFGDLDETASGDFDGDGLSNEGEYAHYTRPDLDDTDGDGLRDGDEILQGANPHLKDHPEVGLEVYPIRDS